MKIPRILTEIALILCVFSSLGSSQSFWLHKQVYGAGLYGICRLAAVDTSNCVIVAGSPGASMTRDYGHSWDYIFQDTAGKLGKYSYSCFVHPSTNLILLGCNDNQIHVGHIIRSADAGKTWSDTALGSYAKAKSPNTILAMAALDSNHIFVLSDSGNFFHSTDGGLTWQSFLCPVFTFFSAPFVSPVVVYPAPNTIVVATLVLSELLQNPNSTLIYRTTDLGVTWDSGFHLNHSIAKFAFINPLVGYASGSIHDYSGNNNDTATIEKTTDAGFSWFNAFSKKNSSIFDIFF